MLTCPSLKIVLAEDSMQDKAFVRAATHFFQKTSSLYSETPGPALKEGPRS